MGRTFRVRKKRKNNARPISLGNDEEFLTLVQWIVSNGWKSTCKLAPAFFSKTGRGLMAKTNIPIDTTLVKIPFNLLITVKTVSESILGPILNNPELTFTTQQILAIFLVWEQHLDKDSQWYEYIMSLPKTYFSPLFCLESDTKYLPKIINDSLRRMESIVERSFSMLESIMKSNHCKHCNKEYNDIFVPEQYKWAWFCVNSRSVYISPEINFAHKIKLSDSNCLALAPYLDMINHSNEAKVNAFFNLKDSTYTVTTAVPFKKYDEVFINYGSHDNIKLFLEYGFILPKNHHDSIHFCCQTTLSAAKRINPSLKNLIDLRFDYLKNHDFLNDLSCSLDGFSWNAKVSLFVLAAPASANLFHINREVFTGTVFIHNQRGFISLAKYIIDDKLKEVNSNIDVVRQFLNTQPSNEIFKICLNLLEEWFMILVKVNSELNLT